jgi:hypothetical protein
MCYNRTGRIGTRHGIFPSNYVCPDMEQLKQHKDRERERELNENLRWTEMPIDEAESDDNRSDSIFSSAAESVMSTLPTLEGSSQDLPGIEGIVSFLATDPGLRPLLAKVLDRTDISSNEFRRRFGNLLKRFAIALNEELETSLHQVPAFIRSRRGIIASKLWTNIGPKVRNGLSEAALEQPIDEGFKKRRLAEFPRPHFKKPSSAYDTVPDLDYSSDGSSDDGSADRETMKFSQYLENRLRTSNALVNLRSALKLWVDSVEVVEREAKESLRSVEALVNLVALITFIPREHITQACILGDTPKSHINKINCF